MAFEMADGTEFLVAVLRLIYKQYLEASMGLYCSSCERIRKHGYVVSRSWCSRRGAQYRLALLLRHLIYRRWFARSTTL